MHEKLIEHIISLGRQDALYIQKEVEQFFVNNTNHLFSLLSEQRSEKSHGTQNESGKNNLTHIKNCIQKGIVWDSPETWTALYKYFRKDSTPDNISEYLYGLKPQVIPHATSFESPIKLPYIHVKIDSNTYSQLKNSLSFSDFCDFLLDKEMRGANAMLRPNTFILRHIFTHQRSGLDDEIYRTNFCRSLARHELSQHSDIATFLIQKYSDSLLSLIEHSSAKNLDYLKTLYTPHLYTQDLVQELMNKMVSLGHTDKIEFLHELAVPLPSDKRSYSDVFSSGIKMEAARYIIAHIEDITTGNHVILKTLLHHNRAELVPLVLERYSDLDGVEEILAGRKQNFALTLTQKAVVAYRLEKSLSQKAHHSIMKI